MPHLRLGSWRLLVAGCAVLLGLTGCGGSDGSGEVGGGGGSAGGGAIGEVTVFAAASLTEAFTEIGKDFEQANPDATVRFNFAGSSTLAQQLIRGAPTDVFVSADRAQMQKVAEADQTAVEPTVFVQNKLQIVVPKANPGKVDGLAAFGKPELDTAICAEQVPCGAASQEAFALAGITPAPDTLEQDVKAVLTKVALGEADAGLVYRTDVASAGGDVTGIDFPEADQAVNDYPIALLNGAPNAAAGQTFVDYVLSAPGKAVLDRFGFITDVT